MSRIDTFAVLADWLHEHRGPPSCMGEAGLWLYVLVAVASPGDVAVSDFSARATKEVDALWPDAPPVLRDLLDAAGLAPVHGPVAPREVVGRMHQRKAIAALAEGLIGAAGTTARAFSQLGPAAAGVVARMSLAVATTQYAIALAQKPEEP